LRCINVHEMSKSILELLINVVLKVEKELPCVYCNQVEYNCLSRYASLMLTALL
jgi:hypothetical protein